MTTAVNTKEAERGFSGYGTITQTAGDKAEAGRRNRVSKRQNKRKEQLLVIRRAKPLRGVCALHPRAWLSWQCKRLCQDRRVEPCRWGGYLFTMFCTARKLHGPITSNLPSLLGTLTSTVDQLVKDLSPGPVVVPSGTSPVTVFLLLISHRNFVL